MKKLIFFLFLMFPLQLFAYELYVDQRNGQVFIEPGKHRVKITEIQTKSVTEDQLKTQLKTSENKINSRIDDIVNKPKKPNEAKTTIDGKGIRFETNDGAFKFSLNGRLHTDAAMYSGGDIATVSEVGGVEIPKNNRQSDGTEIRRLRMEFAGQFYDDYSFKVQPELANGGSSQYTIGIRDAFVKYSGFGDYGQFLAGQSKQPFSYQQMMSSNDLVFMERAMDYTFANSQVNRAIGLRYDLPGSWWGFSTGLYGDTATPQTSGTTDAPDEGWGAAMRATIAPWMKSDELVHLGMSAAYRAPQSDLRTVHYKFKQTSMSPVSYLDTGSITDVQNSQFINGEMVGIYGPFSFETEYNGTWINTNDSETSKGLAAGPGYMQGAHVDVAYSLTGESRAANYKAGEGVTGRLKPNQNLNFSDGWGAWELKARFAWLDMNQIGNQSFAGGNEVSSTIGANWYWNNWSRFMLDWTHVYSLNVGEAGINRKVADIPGNNPGDWDVVQARVSLAY